MCVRRKNIEARISGVTIDRLLFLSLVAFVLAGLLLSCSDREFLKTPWTVRLAETPPDADGTFHYTKSELCALTGLNIAEHRDWTSAIERYDGRAYYLCCPSVMFTIFQDPPRHLGVEREQLKNLWVTEFGGKRILRARETFFVLGSGVTGPLGPDLLAIADRDAALALAAKYPGAEVLTFNQIMAIPFEDFMYERYQKLHPLPDGS